MALQLRRKTHESFLLYRTIVCLILVCLSLSCSVFTNSGKVSQSQIERFHEQIKSGRFEQIYKESAEALKNGISEEKFVNRMSEAVRKMKEVDEALNFQKGELDEILSKQINGEFWTVNFEKLQNEDKKVEFLTQWSKENKDASFKLRSLSVIEPTGTGERTFYVVEQEKVSTE